MPPRQHGRDRQPDARQASKYPLVFFLFYFYVHVYTFFLFIFLSSGFDFYDFYLGVVLGVDLSLGSYTMVAGP
jgi:hypothetical protein